MKFEEWWNKNKTNQALGFRVRGDVQIGWNAALKYGAQNSIDNKQSVQFICCLGGEHVCVSNVNNGYCAEGTGKCQYKVRIN